MKFGTDGRHDITAGGRVDVTHGGMTLLYGGGLAFLFEQQLLGQRLVGERPSVGADRRRHRVLQPREWAQTGMAPKPFPARDVGGRVVGDALGTVLEEAHVHLPRERDVEAVDPRYRVVGRVLVAVEVPPRSQQEVAAAHPDGIAVDHRPDPLALDDETESIL